MYSKNVCVCVWLKIKETRNLEKRNVNLKHVYNRELNKNPLFYSKKNARA